MGVARKRSRINKKAKRQAAVVSKMGPIREVEAPSEDKVVLKEVPAKIWRDKGTPQEEFEVVGSAIIYEDGTVDVIYFEDRSNMAAWAVEQLVEMLDTRQALTHYSLPDILKERGEANGSS